MNKILITGGAFASIKHVMHTEPELMDKYDYFLFHTDDSVYINGDNWGSEIIDEYKNNPELVNGGIIGREVIPIRLGPKGLIDHRNCGPQIAEIHGVKEVITVPHLHADWYFLDRRTMETLSEVWFYPMHSQRAMDYQKSLENSIFSDIAMVGDNRETLDNMHIGRETDVAPRLVHYGMNAVSYTGNKIVFEKHGAGRFNV